HLDAGRKRLGTDGTRTAVARVRDSGAGPGVGARGGRGPETVRGPAERTGTISHHGGVGGGSSRRPGGGIGGTCAGGGGHGAVGSGSRERSGRDGAGAMVGGAARVPRAAGHPRQTLRRAGVPGGEPGAKELTGGRELRPDSWGFRIICPLRRPQATQCLASLSSSPAIQSGINTGITLFPWRR